MNLLAASTLTDLGPNSTLRIKAGLGEISEHICPAFGLSGSLPPLSLEGAEYKGQRGLGRSRFGRLGELLICFPH